jgi:DNA-binding MarR family transcriptional regulator
MKSQKKAANEKQSKTKRQQKTQLKSHTPHAPALSQKSTDVASTQKVYFGFCFYKTAMRMRAMMDEELAPYGILAPQMGLLNHIYKNGSVSQIEVGKELQVDGASMVRFIDSLETKGYLARVTSPQDRRIKLLEVTKSGEKLIKELHLLREKVENRVLAPLTEKEKATLKKIIAKLFN